MSNCILTIGSVTQSMKAVSVLNAYSIPVKTVKLSSANGRSGCVYGIEFNCGYDSNIRKILETQRIRYGAKNDDLS